MITAEYVLNTFKAFKDEIISEVNAVKTELSKEIKELRDSLDEKVKEEVLKAVNHSTCKLKNDILELQTKCAHLSEENQKLSHEMKIFKERVIEQEDRGRRLNLIIDGIADPEEGNFEESVSDFFIEKLSIDRDKVQSFNYRNIHPLGKKTQDNTRKMIVAFTDQRDRDFILNKAPLLKGSDFSIRANYSPETAKMKDQLMKTRRTLLNDRKQARIVEQKYKPILQVKNANGRWEQYKCDDDEFF